MISNITNVKQVEVMSHDHHFRRNPYNCTCESRPLFNFIKNQYTEVIDIHDVEMHCDHGLY